MKEANQLENAVVLTLDIDWAPDFAIDFVADKLVERQVRATWFVTHESPAIIRLKQYPELFELGIHPNFFPGSSHGASVDAVLRYCMALVPEAVSVRTHGLLQSTRLLGQILAQTPIKIDVSLFLPHTPHLRPVEYPWEGRTLLRIPYFWEDDFEMEYRARACWNLGPLLEEGAGLKVFDFHPLLVLLNCIDIESIRALKHVIPRLSEASPSEVDAFIHVGRGTQTLFMEVIDHLAATRRSVCIRDIHTQWQHTRREA